ncbi:MAG: HlyD family efflux transporter periplasmic adaptor subunit [Lachnospiraceae bacterium]|nr:HlyD family efflux transporter periplasmic adaptor subunit [Lachnospiraceae bacterium]
MNKKRSWKKIGKRAFALLVLVAIMGAAVYSVMEKQKEEQVVMVYKEHTVQKGSLRNEITENGSVSFGIVSEEYELNLGDTEDDDEENYLKIDEVYVAVGQRIKEGDAIYRFTEDSVADVRKKLQYAKTEAQIAVSEAQTAYELGVLEAQLTYDESMLTQSLAEATYTNKIARMSNEIATKNLEIEQLLADIYKIQCELTDEDYLEQKDAIRESYEEAIEAVEEASDKFVTNQVVAMEALRNAEVSYEVFLASADDSNKQIADKIEQIAEIQEDMAFYEVLIEKELILASKELETANLAGSIADVKQSSSLSSYETTLTKAQEELQECTERLESFDAFVGDGTVYAKGSGLVTEVGYEEGTSLISAGILLSYAVSDAMTIQVDVSQEDVTTMKVGDRVEIQFSPYEDVYEGVIESITTTATSRNSATISYPVTILILGETSRIYGGMTADVTFVMEETAEVLYVPRKAIVEENGKEYVYVKSGEAYVLSEVTTGFMNGANVEIVSGLQENDIYYIASVAVNEEKNNEAR